MLAVALPFGAFQRHWTLQRDREAIASTPLEWQPFNWNRLNAMLDKGKPVLVVYFSHWKDRPLWRLDTKEVRLAIYDKQLEIMDGNCHFQSLRPSGVREAMARVTADGDWCGAIYYPDSSVATFTYSPDPADFARKAVMTIRQR